MEVQQISRFALMACMAHDGSMPHKDPETRKAYLKSYHKRYAKRHADVIKDRRAAWFQDNKPTIIKKQRVQRRQVKSAEAMGALMQIAAKLT